ncbi:MAG: alpha/beta hydrolase [Clostridiales bacterium]|nr:alpha/beta hydrolase [Candidatus Blautia equi]
MKKKNLAGRIVLTIFLLLMVCGIVGAGVYLVQSFSPESTALEIMEENEALIKRRTGVRESLIYRTKNPVAALIFYPGAKVPEEAYIPMMQALAEQHILCIIPHMPFDLAFFKPGAAENLKELYPDIESWYIGGHSLGACMAASYVSKHTEEYDGLILLAGYSMKDLSDSGLKVLSMYGSEDEILSKERYNKYYSNLPDDTKEVVIDGGCHAYFGYYGEQKGDGTPTISHEEQMQQTVDQLLEMILPAEEAEADAADEQ